MWFICRYQKKNPRILPPRSFLLASSWSIMPPDVVRTTYPNCLDGRRLLVHFSISPIPMSNLGERSQEDLPLPPFLSIVHAPERVSQRVHTHHDVLLLCFSCRSESSNI